MALRVMRNVSLNGSDVEAKREEIRRYFHDTFDIYEKLFEVMANEKAYYKRADALRHPIIFYYGHTAVFYINKLILAKVIDKRIDQKLESIFAVGVDEMSWDDLNEAHYEWSSLVETKTYRDTVRATVDKLISSMPLTLPIGWDSPFWIILMGIEHERIHLETSSVLIRQLPMEFVTSCDAWKICQESGEAPKNELLPVSGGKVLLGKSKEDDFYGWDNEYGCHKADIPDFKASKYLVSNGEFLAFVNDGGYERDEFWNDEGLGWKNYIKPEHPLFWIKEGDNYKFRTMVDAIDLPMSWPVEVNYLEAKAYCNWLSFKQNKKLRLPTEDEWYRLREVCEIPDEPGWSDKAPGNINLEYYASSTPVDRFKHGDFYDVIGNVWQWTQTPIYPFEGFEVHPIYDDFTTPTYDNKHNLIKGGSWISTGNETLKDSRYAFRRHFFQHAGFRYVESSYEESVEANIYETDTLIAQYAEFGWGKSYFNAPSYPKTCADLCLEYMINRPKTKALDIGCAIGRSTFELAKEFEQVIGLDFTARFIQLATQMKEQGSIHYTIPIEGELVEYKSSKLEDFGLKETAKKVEFWQGDACNLKPIYQGFDLIYAGNLIDRLYSPKKFLQNVHERLNDKGVLILTSPYTWLEEFTQKDEWLGGFKKDGENFTTLDGLKELLNENFKLIDTPKDIEFAIRETGRKFQHTIAQMSVWEKR